MASKNAALGLVAPVSVGVGETVVLSANLWAFSTASPEVVAIGGALARGVPGRAGWFIPRTRAPADAPAPETPSVPALWSALTAAGTPSGASTPTTSVPSRIHLAPQSGIVWSLTGMPTAAICSARGGSFCNATNQIFTGLSGSTTLTIQAGVLRPGFVYRIEASAQLTASWSWLAPSKWPAVVSGPIAVAAASAAIAEASAVPPPSSRLYDPSATFYVGAASSSRTGLVYVRPPPTGGGATLSPRSGTAFYDSFSLETVDAAWIREPSGVLETVARNALSRMTALAFGVGAPASVVSTLALNVAGGASNWDTVSSAVATLNCATELNAGTLPAWALAASIVGAALSQPNVMSVCSSWLSGAVAAAALADGSVLPASATNAEALRYFFRVDTTGSTSALSSGDAPAADGSIPVKGMSFSLSTTLSSISAWPGSALIQTDASSPTWTGQIPVPANTDSSGVGSVWVIVIAQAADGGASIAASKALVTSPLVALASNPVSLAALAAATLTANSSISSFYSGSATGAVNAVVFASQALIAASSALDAGFGSASSRTSTAALIASQRTALGAAIAGALTAAATAASPLTPAIDDTALTATTLALSTSTSGFTVASVSPALTALSNVAALSSAAVPVDAVAAKSTPPLNPSQTAALLNVVTSVVGTIEGASQITGAPITTGMSASLLSSTNTALLAIAGAALRGANPGTTTVVSSTLDESASTFCGSAFSVGAVRLGGGSAAVVQGVVASGSTVLLAPIPPCPSSATSTVTVPASVRASAAPAVYFPQSVLTALASSGAADAIVHVYGLSPYPEFGSTAAFYTALTPGRGSTGAKIAQRRLSANTSDRQLGVLDAVSSSAGFVAAGGLGTASAFSSTLSAASVFAPLNSTVRDMVPSRPLDTRVTRIALGLPSPLSAPVTVTLPWRDPSIVVWDAAKNAPSDFNVGQAAINALQRVVNITCPVSAAAAAQIVAVYTAPRSLMGAFAPVRLLNVTTLTFTSVSGAGSTASAGVAGAGAAVVSRMLARALGVSASPTPSPSTTPSASARPYSAPLSAGVTLTTTSGLAYALSVDCGEPLGAATVVCGPGSGGRTISYTCPRAVAVPQCVVWSATLKAWTPLGGCSLVRVDGAGATCDCRVPTADVAARFAVLPQFNDDIFTYEVPKVSTNTWSAHPLLIAAIAGVLFLGVSRCFIGAALDARAHYRFTAALNNDAEVKATAVLARARGLESWSARALDRYSFADVGVGATVAPFDETLASPVRSADKIGDAWSRVAELALEGFGLSAKVLATDVKPAAFPLATVVTARARARACAVGVPAFSPETSRSLGALTDAAAVLIPLFFSAAFDAALVGARDAKALTATAGWDALSPAETFSVGIAAAVVSMPIVALLRAAVRGAGRVAFSASYVGIADDLRARAEAEALLGALPTRILRDGLTQDARVAAEVDADAARELFRDASAELRALLDDRGGVAAAAARFVASDGARSSELQRLASQRVAEGALIATPKLFAAALADRLSVRPKPLCGGVPSMVISVLTGFLLLFAIFFCAYFGGLFGYVAGPPASLALLGAWVISAGTVGVARIISAALDVARAASAGPARATRAAARPLRARLEMLSIPRAAAVADSSANARALICADARTLSAAAAFAADPAGASVVAERSALMARWFALARGADKVSGGAPAGQGMADAWAKGDAPSRAASGGSEVGAPAQPQILQTADEPLPPPTVSSSVHVSSSALQSPPPPEDASLEDHVAWALGSPLGGAFGGVGGAPALVGARVAAVRNGLNIGPVLRVPTYEPVGGQLPSPPRGGAPGVDKFGPKSPTLGAAAARVLNPTRALGALGAGARVGPAPRGIVAVQPTPPRSAPRGVPAPRGVAVASARGAAIAGPRPSPAPRGAPPRGPRGNPPK